MLILLSVLACGSAPVEEPGVSEVLPAFTNAEGQLVCPVMGDVIESRQQAVGHTEHEGTDYYFCCDSCQHMFGDDPERYANGKFLDHLKEAHDGHFVGNCTHIL